MTQHCRYCPRVLYAKASKDEGICGLCTKSVHGSMKRPPSYYIGSTRRTPIDARLADKARWEASR